MYVTWDGLDVDLLKVRERSDLIAELSRLYPETKARAISNRAGLSGPLFVAAFGHKPLFANRRSQLT